MKLRTTCVGLAVVFIGVGSRTSGCAAFAPPVRPSPAATATATAGVPLGRSCRYGSRTSLRMGLDLVTYLRTEWVSAALCTNQTPRSADVCLQLGCEDGRGVTFVPRTIREYWTSTTQADGILPLSVRRQLQQSETRRGAAKVKMMDQRADELKETRDESVDVVISLQAAAKMFENGLDWKKSIDEAARVLKPGGRLLFVEQTTLNGESYLEYVENLGLDVERSQDSDDNESDAKAEDDDEDEERFAIFDDIGFDEVDLVLTPHTAGVAVKSIDAGLTAAERRAKAKKEEMDKQAEVSILAFERGLKKRKRKKKDQDKAAAK